MSKAIAVYYCGYEKCASGHSFGPAVRTQYLLHYVISGKGLYTVGGLTYSVTAGQAFLIKPSELTYYQADEEAPWEYMWMAFDGIEGKETVRRTGFEERYVADIPDPEAFQRCMSQIIREFEKETGRGVLCNRPYSGTEVIRDYGREHLKTGKLIVYTSADSVFQIAAHEEKVPLEELYADCRIARKIMTGEHGVGRVIARPFVGEYPDFTRTVNRHDFSVEPPKETLLDALKKAGKSVIGVGKIYDIFAGRGITETFPNKGNARNMEQTLELMDKEFEGLCFVNLVDFDMIYGHRNDIDGYVCEKCKNKGYIAYRNAGETMTIKPCECLERRKHINIVEQSNMGDLIHKDLKQFVAKEKWQMQMKQSAQDYIKQRRTTWIAYLGQSGCGKTHIASCIANDYLFNRKTRIIYANWSNLAQDIRNDEWNHIDVYDTTSHEYQVSSVPVLFIDDFLKGSESSKQDIRIAYRIINQRYIRNVTTIITSELTMDEIKKIDEAIARRIYERCDSNIMQVFKDTNKNFSFTKGE